MDTIKRQSTAYPRVVKRDGVRILPPSFPETSGRTPLNDSGKKRTDSPR
jgi:hypothetical protein